MLDEQRENRFAELLEQSHRQLFAYLYALLRNYGDAQDVFQQTSLTLWEKFDEFEAGTSFMAWACSVGRMKALNLLRRQRRYRAHFSEAFQLKLAAIQASVSSETINERSQALNGCVEKLPPNQQELLRQCFGGDQSVGHVACELGRTTHSIYSSLRNIRKKLLDCVDRSVSEGETE